VTLQELIEQAQALLSQGAPPTALVYSEGCDCVGEATELTFEEKPTGYTGEAPGVVLGRER
jgi:hypothetical protein